MSWNERGSVRSGSSRSRRPKQATAGARPCLLLAILVCTACPWGPDDGLPIETGHLFLIYLTASNDLESYGMADFEEIKASLEGLSDSVVLVLMDRIADYYDQYHDWDETRLFEFKVKDCVVTDRELEAPELGLSLDYIDDDLNMGDAETLRCFLDYAHSRYVFDHAYLDIWDHGGGWKAIRSREIAYDQESRDVLFMKEVVTAINDSKLGGFDIVLLDACSMATLENAVVFIGKAETLIFPQTTVPSDGFPYNEVIPILCSRKSAETKSSEIVSAYKEKYDDIDTSLTAVQIDGNGGLQGLLDEFCLYVKLYITEKPIWRLRRE